MPIFSETNNFLVLMKIVCDHLLKLYMLVWLDLSFDYWIPDHGMARLLFGKSVKNNIILICSEFDWILCYGECDPCCPVNSIQALLSAPNPDDPLSENIAKHWKSNEAEAVETGMLFLLAWLHWSQLLFLNDGIKCDTCSFAYENDGIEICSQRMDPIICQWRLMIWWKILASNNCSGVYAINCRIENGNLEELSELFWSQYSS